MTLYVDLLNWLILKCTEYRSKKITTSEFHQVIVDAEQIVTAYEEKELRHFVMLMENEIDYIQVMNNEADFMYKDSIVESDCFESILPVAKRLEENCIKRL
jgi:hypothetical protein